MKHLTISLAVLLITLLLCALNYRYVKISIEELIDGLDKIEESVKSNSWDRALELTDEYADKWLKRERFYLAVLFHDHVDDVGLAFAQLRQDVMEKNASYSLKSIIIARTILTDIIDMEAFRIENIL